MSKLRFKISISLDGFVAGPNQSVQNPLGIGGERLHEWPVVEESMRNIGATIMGRNMFGGHPGPWKQEEPWTGWWGKNPPFHHPVFVLTHHARSPLECEGGTTFTFVTDGIESALAQAKRAANGKDVTLAGGAAAARQYLNAGLVDEMELALAPTLLGAGERLFDGTGDDLRGLSLVRTVATPRVVHLKFVKQTC
jgi:dihydrofolate reductase